MSTLLQRILIAVGRRGVQVAVDQTLGNAYRALQQYQRAYPSVFNNAAEILLAEVEGGATEVSDIPRRLGHLVQLLDRLTREEELETWADEDVIVVV